MNYTFKSLVFILLFSINAPIATALAQPTSDYQGRNLKIGIVLTAASLIGTFFSYKSLKNLIAEETKFAELRKALVAMGARVTQSSHDDGFALEHSLKIEPNAQWVAGEGKNFNEYSNDLEKSFHDRHSAVSNFFMIATPTALMGIFGITSLFNAFKN